MWGEIEERWGSQTARRVKNTERKAVKEDERGRKGGVMEEKRKKERGEGGRAGPLT